MENYIDDAHIHEGHRERMRAKLLKHGQEIFDTYELLEMLLYHVIPYKDTNPISKRLLAAFGSLDGVFTATKDELTQVSGVGERTAEFIIEVGKLSSIIGAELTSENDDCFSSYESVGEFFVEMFWGLEKECVGAMFFDSSMRLVSSKRLYDLDFESGGVKPKLFIDEAVRSRASVVISAHSHPFGPFYPSPGDRTSNNTITDALSMAGLVHAEHYIVSGRNYAGIGSLKNFTSKLSQMPMLTEFLKSKNDMESNVQKVSSVNAENIDSSTIRNSKYCNSRDYGYFVSLLKYAVGGSADKTADLLLPKYRTIEGVFCASGGHLTADSTEKCAFYLKILAYVTARRETDKFKYGNKPTKAQIADFLKALFLGQSIEKTYLLSFNSRGETIGCDLLGEGTVNASEILPRKAIETAIGHGASSVVIAHNHPGGVASPSVDDLNLTNALASIFTTCDIYLTDHYIIAGQLCEIINVSGE